MHDPETTKTLSSQLPDFDAPDGPISVDWAQVQAEYTARALDATRAARARRLRERYPGVVDFDIAHSKLEATRAQCAAVVGWRYGPKGLLLVGEHGGGKTRSAFALVQRLMTHDRLNVDWWTAQDLAGRICEEVEYGVDEARKFIDALSDARCLVIDDLGQEEVNASQRDRVQAWMLSLIDKRCVKGLPMIVTTNYGAKRMYVKYGHERGGAIARRLSEHCEVLRFG